MEGAQLAELSAVGEDLRIPLSIDDELRKRLAEVNMTDGSVILVGYRNMGKTLAIKRVMNDPDVSPYYNLKDNYEEVPKEPLPEDYPTSFRDSFKKRLIIECRPYQLEYILRGETLRNGAEKGAVERWKTFWVKRLHKEKASQDMRSSLPGNM